MLALGLSLGLSVVAVEVLVRGVLFGDWFAGVEAAEVLRAPRSYSHFDEDVNWALRARRDHGPGGREPNRSDPVVGWLGAGAVPGTYDHSERGLVERQRAVLLFGDSFAAGMVEPEEKFQALFEASRLGEGMQLLNYGVGGYGLDQIYLLANRALPAWVEARPVVLMSLYLDDDIDRCGLAFRGWPKPRFRLVDGELALEREACPSAREYLDEAFSPLTSWTWRLLLHQPWVEALARPASEEEPYCDAAHTEGELQAIARALLEANLDDLEASGLPYGYVLFHGHESFERPELLGWREELVVDVLERRGVPYVLSRELLTAHLREHPRSHYFIRGGVGKNHLTGKGNQVVLDGMVELIERLVAEEPTPWVPPPARVRLAEYAATELVGRKAGLMYIESRGQLYWMLGGSEPSEVHYRLEEPSILGMRAWLPFDLERAERGATPRGQVDLTLLLNGAEVYGTTLRRGDDPLDVELELGPGDLVVRARSTAGLRRSTLLTLGDLD